MDERSGFQKKRDGRANRSLLRRVVFLMVVCGILMFSALGWKLWQLQIRDHDYYQELAVNQQTRDVTVSANRGTIYDASGNIMAISATVYQLILSPRDLIATVDKSKYDDDASYQAAITAKENEVVSGLVPLTGLDEDAIRAKLQKTNSAYQVLVKDLEDKDCTSIRTYISDNHTSSYLYLTPGSKRYYPYSSVASHIMGFVGVDGKGAYGVEAVYDSQLSGQSGRVVTAKNASGTEMLSSYEAYMDAVNGDNLTLTIDANIQSMAEQALKEGIEKYAVRHGGFCIVMNPNTGAILAMASYPNYDPNDSRTVTDPSTLASLAKVKEQYGEDSDEYGNALVTAQYAQWRNKAIADTYEPGSTFKPLVVAAALEEGAVTTNSTFNCTGSYTVGGWTIKCHKHAGHGLQTLAQAVQNSCNPALIQIGQKLGANSFYDYLENYGLLERTGIDLGGESDNSSLVWSRDYFTSAEGLSSVAAASFGQTLKVTPIQMITAFSSVINGGHLMTPYLLQSVSDSDGNVVSYTQPTEKRQVVSESVSETVRGILESVVSEGTGKNAYMAGYRIGGKTGTSQKRDETTGDLITSFMGFAPADDPQIIVLLALDSPTPASPGASYTADGTYISGGNMAAPLAGQLIADICDYKGIEQQYSTGESDEEDVTVPGLAGCTKEDAEQQLKDKGLTYTTVGDGANVTGQIPASGAYLPAGSEVILYLGADVPTDQVEVPNVVGMSPSSAEAALKKVGLYLRATGISGDDSQGTTATTQSIDAGTKVSRGTVVEVRFVDSTISDYVIN